MHVSRINIYCTSIQITLHHVHFQRGKWPWTCKGWDLIGIVCGEFMLGGHEKLVLNKKKWNRGNKEPLCKVVKAVRDRKNSFPALIFSGTYESMYDRIIQCQSVCYTILNTNVHACHQLHKMNWVKYYFHIIWQPGSKVLFTCLWLCHQ